MNKKELRQQFLAKRDELDQNTILEKSEMISKHLSVVDEFVKSRVVMMYMSTGSEVSTDAIIQHCLMTKKVVVPKVVEERSIVPSLIMSTDNMIPGFKGIPEPIDALPVKLQNIDLVIVPGIVFDKSRNRIGYGLGMYDMFLKTVAATKIGLAFDMQIVDEIPYQEHDVKMDMVITEKGVILP